MSPGREELSGGDREGLLTARWTFLARVAYAAPWQLCEGAGSGIWGQFLLNAGRSVFGRAVAETRHEGFDRKGESLSEEETRAKDNMKRERNQRRSRNWSGGDEVAVEEDEGFIQEHWSCRRPDAGSERHGHENPHSTTLT
jgi:hypothetical protein